MSTPITPGDIWVRKSDGQETTILQAPGAWIHNGRVVHKAKRVTRTLTHDFYRKYAPKEDTP